MTPCSRLLLRLLAVPALLAGFIAPLRAADSDADESFFRRKRRSRIEAAAEKRQEETVRNEVRTTHSRHEAPAEPQEPASPYAARRTPPYPAAAGEWDAERFDSLLACWHALDVIESHERFFNHYIDVDPEAPAAADAVPDSVYVNRIRALASPVPLPFNNVVKATIARYVNPQSTLMGRILGMAEYYFPMIEEELIKAGLPIELRALPIIESALSPQAVSRVGAGGLWQFMPSTGKIYGLEINSLVDERFDPLTATRAACRMLREMYAIYHDWALALAAYNCGAGNVNKAIARSGGKTFWEIYDFLPKETRGYVPAFIAASYAYAYHGLHGIRTIAPPVPLTVDTVQITRLLHLGQVASTLDNVPIETLRLLNPQYKLDIVPATTKSYPLTLPQYAVTKFIEAEPEIYAKDSLFLKEYLNPVAVEKKRTETAGGSTIYYKVKRGDTLGKIAQKYHVSQKNLMRWNNIRNANTLREGQRLKIVR